MQLFILLSSYEDYSAILVYININIGQDGSIINELFIYNIMRSVTKLNRNLSRLKPLFTCFHNNYLFSNFDTKKDYYKILGVDKSATDAQIKSAFYKLAKQYHPDHNKGYQAKFKEVNQAYTVLSDDQVKKQYESARSSGSGYSSQGYYGSGYGNTGYGNYGNYGNTGNYGSGYGSSYNSGAGNYGNYSDYGNTSNNEWRRNREKYQEKDFQQNGYYEYDPYQKSNRNNSYYSNRNNYQNPYEAYERFKWRYAQANADARQKMRKAQQQRYEDWLKYHEQEQADAATGFSRAARLTLIMTIFLVLFTIGARSRNHPAQYQQYQYPQNAQYVAYTQPVGPYAPYSQQQYYQSRNM